MGPRHMKFTPDGKTLYVLNELDLSVSIFRTVANGKLEFVSTHATTPDGYNKEGMSAAEIRIHPNGEFVFTSNRDKTRQRRDSITVFRTGDDGLERMSSTYPEVWFPRNFNISPCGKWLIVGGQRSKDIAVFSFDPETGALTFSGQTLNVDGEPTCFEFMN